MNGMFNVASPIFPAFSKLIEIEGIGESQWAFKTNFHVTKEDLTSPNIDLVFDGLDTFVTAFLVSSHFG